MNKYYSAKIKERLDEAEHGSVLIMSDFADIADSATIRQSLSRLVDAGELSRVLPGVFSKPEYSTFLNEFVAPSPDAIAHALARRFRWTIAPSGTVALNLLGLSEQVPVVWIYASDGPYRKYDLGKEALEFRHTANRDITAFSPSTSLVFRALKELGKDSLSDEIIQKIGERLSPEEKHLLLAETVTSTEWVRRAAKKICSASEVHHD